jgi:hypothetical protein
VRCQCCLGIPRHLSYRRGNDSTSPVGCANLHTVLQTVVALWAAGLPCVQAFAEAQRFSPLIGGLVNDQGDSPVRLFLTGVSQTGPSFSWPQPNNGLPTSQRRSLASCHFPRLDEMHRLGCKNARPAEDTPNNRDLSHIWTTQAAEPTQRAKGKAKKT